MQLGTEFTGPRPALSHRQCRSVARHTTVALLLLSAILSSGLTLTMPTAADEWPRWRGPGGNGVSERLGLPQNWSRGKGIAWSVAIPGEGFSSPIVCRNRVFLTAAEEFGEIRALYCLNAADGHVLWRRTIEDEDPELTSAMTGHAAATPVTDGRYVVAFFGNAGVVCYDYDGRLQWRHRFEPFETELGLASSPIIEDGRVLLVCDHDGSRFRTFDSFLTALDVATGQVRWRTNRPGLFRSWSTPIVVAGDGEEQLVVNAQDELRAYSVKTGELRWRVDGMTGWVTPSPVFGEGLIFATSGKDGPTLAVRCGGDGDVTDSHVVWQVDRGSPYVCSPLYYRGRLYVHDELGILSCYQASSGDLLYRERLGGKFTASAVAGDGKIYLTDERATTYVLADGPTFQLLAKNALDQYCLASPALVDGRLLLRTEQHLHCIQGAESRPAEN